MEVMGSPSCGGESLPKVVLREHSGIYPLPTVSLKATAKMAKSLLLGSSRGKTGLKHPEVSQGPLLTNLEEGIGSHPILSLA